MSRLLSSVGAKNASVQEGKKKYFSAQSAQCAQSAHPAKKGSFENFLTMVHACDGRVCSHRRDASYLAHVLGT